MEVFIAFYYRLHFKEKLTHCLSWFGGGGQQKPQEDANDVIKFVLTHNGRVFKTFLNENKT